MKMVVVLPFPVEENNGMGPSSPLLLVNYNFLEHWSNFGWRHFDVTQSSVCLSGNWTQIVRCESITSNNHPQLLLYHGMLRMQLRTYEMPYVTVYT